MSSSAGRVSLRRKPLAAAWLGAGVQLTAERLDPLAHAAQAPAGVVAGGQGTHAVVDHLHVQAARTIREPDPDRVTLLACLPTLVRPSWTIRYAVVPTTVVCPASSPSITSSTGRPAARASATRRLDVPAPARAEAL